MGLAHKPARVIVAASGAGRSLENLIKAQESQDRYEVVGVLSSNADCGAVKVAQLKSLPVYVESFGGSLKASDELQSWLLERKPDWILLAGFLKVFPVIFNCMNFDGKIINIHPSLLPKFGGKGMYGHRVHQAVLDSGEHESGASIHFVDSEYDQGQIIAQIKVPVHGDDDADSLAQRVFSAECRLYPQVLADLVSGHLPLAGREVRVWHH